MVVAADNQVDAADLHRPPRGPHRLLAPQGAGVAKAGSWKMASSQRAVSAARSARSQFAIAPVSAQLGVTHLGGLLKSPQAEFSTTTCQWPP